MPFSPCHAPATFEWLMESLLGGQIYNADDQLHRQPGWPAARHTPLHPPKSENGQWLHEGILYDQLANSAGFQEGDQVWYYYPTQKTGKSPKLQSSWEGPYNIVTQINNVIDRIQQYPRLFHDVFRQWQEKVLSRKAEIDRKRWARASDQSVTCSGWSKCASDRLEVCEAMDEHLCVTVLQGNQEMSEPVTWKRTKYKRRRGL